MSTRIAICSYSRGTGNGIAQMDNNILKYINKSDFKPLYIFINTETDNIFKQISKSNLVFSLNIALEVLPKIFENFNIVQFNGSYDPVVSASAEISQKPMLVEVMHNVEPGMMHPFVYHTICVSNRVKLSQLNQKKSSVIYNGINTDKFSFSRRPTYKEKIILMQPSRRKKAIYAHLDDLSEHINLISDNIEYWMVGEGQTKQRCKSIQNVKYFGIQKNMHIFFSNADFMVLFAKNDPFGLVAAEAMSCGCLPIVSSDSGSTEFIEHGITGYIVDCCKRSNMVDCIVKAVNNYSKDSILRINARNIIVKFDIRNTIKTYEETYHLLLNRHKNSFSKKNYSLELSILESQILTLVLYYKHGRTIKDLLPLIKSISNSKTLLDPGRIQHPFWANALHISSEIFYKAALIDNKKTAEYFCKKLLLSKIIFDDYIERFKLIS